MRHAAKTAALLSILSVDCAGTGKPAGQAQSEQAQSEQAQRVSPEALASDRRATLAGSWSGTTQVPGYGTVVATFTLDSEGSGYYFVTASGQHLQGPFKLVSWQKSYLLVEARGHQERVHATHRGHELWIDHALIGQARLVRAPD